MSDKRVFGGASDGHIRLRRSVEIALGPLRTYLDEPEFHLTLALRDRVKPNHPDEVRRAIWHGNFEGVLDEYFAIHAGLGTQAIDPGREGKAFDALEQALAIRVSSIRVQSLESSEAFGLRCHVLDFHVYCDRIVHWDLPASPVDLEQRDGRVNRYGGLTLKITTVLPPGQSYWRFSGSSFAPCYLNAYGANGAVITAKFGDHERDEAARKALICAFPGRTIRMLDIYHIAAGGGGIHCLTQPIPFCRD